MKSEVDEEDEMLPNATCEPWHEKSSLHEESSQHVLVEVELPKTERKKTKKTKTPARKRWICVTWMLSFCCLPICLSACGKMTRKDVQMAWREKVALNIIIAIVCSVMLFYIIGLGRIICPQTHVLSQGEIEGKNSLKDPYVTIYGNYYKISDVVTDHVTQKTYLNSLAMKNTTLGRDVSSMFYRTPLWSQFCPGLSQPSGWDNILRSTPADAMKVWYPHNARSATGPIDYLKMIDNMKKGAIARDENWIQATLAADTEHTHIVVAYQKVYDISAYYDLLNPSPGFLGSNVKKIFDVYGKSGGEVTSFFEQIKKLEGAEKHKSYVRCMDAMFYTGVVDMRLSFSCVFSNYMLLASTLVLISVIGFKFIAAFQMGGGYTPEEHSKYVIIQIPCYTEGKEALTKTLDALARTKYDDMRKLIFIICDGMVIGRDNDKATPQIVLDILGIPEDEVTEPKHFSSLGDGSKQINMGKVYSGLYNCQGRKTPFIVVVKIGTEEEKKKPGNRGKRDSQLILMRFLSKVYYEQPLNPLELDIYYNMNNVIGVRPQVFDFVLMVDADTEVNADSINRMVSCMTKDGRIIGLCGETLISNENDSWVSMIQVYEYFISHHMAKAFESMFGTVTCLPGCFCMYRLKDSANDIPFLISKNILNGYSENNVDTLHKKNLLHLGEDRYLTTLMMKFFPNYKLCFTAEAKCKTIAPNDWSVFISQRRRWINSTVHNLFELILLKQLCGCFFFSMRFVVFLDLFATMVQPASLIYVGYLIFSLLDDQSQFPLISLVMIGAIYGLQLVIILFKREWQNIGWMLIYMLAMPFWAFFLPVYSFWHFDDFSWGNTRKILGESGKVVEVPEFDDYEPQEIPEMKWVDYEKEFLNEPEPIIVSNEFFDTRNVVQTPDCCNSDSLEFTSNYQYETEYHSLPTDELIYQSLWEIVKSCDPQIVTRKEIVAMLKRRFPGVDFTCREQFVKDSILRIVTELSENCFYFST